MNISSKYFLFIRLIKYLINEYHLKVFQVNKNHQKQYLRISFYLSNHTQKLFYKSLLTKKHIFKQGHTYWREKYISQEKKNISMDGKEKLLLAIEQGNNFSSIYFLHYTNRQIYFLTTLIEKHQKSFQQICVYG